MSTSSVEAYRYGRIAGDPYPETCAQRALGAEDFFCCGSHAGAAAGFFCKKSTYPFGVEDVKRE
jgi:hypothetical protein